MTDVASLKLAVDSTDVKSGVAALDGMTAAGKKTATSANQLEAALKAEAIAAERAAKGLVTASSAAGKLRMQQGLAAEAMDKVVKSGAQVQANLGGMGKASGLAGYQVQNLAYQLNDVAVSLASGQKPMTVFMQQGSQIAQIMMGAGLGLGGFVKAIGSMVGGFLLANPLILAGAGVVGVLAAGIGLVTEEINKTSAVTVTWQDTMLGAFDVVTGAVSGAVTSAFQAMGLDIGAVWESVKAYTKGAINFMIGASLAVPKTIAATYKGIPAAFGDAFYSAANLAIEALNKLAQMSAAPINLIIKGLNFAFGTTIPEIMIGGLEKIANPYAGKMAALGAAGAKAFIGAMTTDHVGNIGEALFDSTQARARARIAAEKAGKDVGGRAGKAAGAAASKAMADEWAERMAKDLESTYKILGEASVAMAANDNAAVNARFDEIGESAQRSADAIIAGFEQAREEARRLDDELRDVVSTLESMGGLGQGLGTIGRIFGTMQSGQDRLGGVYGSVLAQLANVQWRSLDKAGNTIIKKLGEELANIFGRNGEFTRILQGAGIGMSIGGAVGGGGTGSQIGGALGGAAGNYFAPAVTKAIGGVVGGVLGAALPVIGGIIGGLIGGLFKKAKTGSASVTQSGISIGGNNADAKGNTSGIGGSVQGSLAKIIEALGGTAGSYGFSIGQREDEFRVSGTAGADVTGKNPGGLLYRGKSAEEAARVALLNALNDGAVAGIREGASNLLKAGKDLESALAKALKFNAVFDELAKEADPVQYAMDALNKELADLKGIFDEAGASASDYAALEELSAIKRAKAYNEAIAPQRDLEIQILRLEGKELEATNAERAMELAGLNATLRPLQERVYALTDETIAAQKAAEAAAQLAAAQEEAARAAAEAAARIETERAELTMRLLELQDSAAAKTMRRMQELAAITDDANRAIQAQIFVQEDINEARAKLSDAYKRERAELGATADKFRQFADGLRAFRDTLYDNDNGLLSYSAAKARLRSVGAAAALGSTEAMGNLPGVSRAFLDASKESSRTLLDYQRDVATVARYVDKAIGAADGAVSNAERQIEALDKSVEGLLSIDEQVITVREAIDNLNALLVPPTAEMAELQKVADKAAADFQLRLVQEVRGMREESNVTAMRMVELTAKMERLWTRFETDGLKVRGDVEDPVYTVAA